MFDKTAGRMPQQTAMFIHSATSKNMGEEISSWDTKVIIASSST